ncbi:nucleoside deaminase [Alishewanella longhuensis]
MALAIELSRQNVLRGTGGPFGSAIFEVDSGKLISVGVNRVMPLSNSSAHGEMVAIMLAEQAVQSFSLAADGVKRELFTSCEPCAMCLGGTLWSGVKRLVCAATAGRCPGYWF